MTPITSDSHVLAPLLRHGNTPDIADRTAIRWWNFGRRRASFGPELTYRELTTRIENTARGLRSAGLKSGDRVLFSIRPRPAGIILALAIVRAGGSIVFVDPGSTPELFAARVAAAQPRFAATESLLYALSCAPLRGIARKRGLLLPDYRRLDVRHFYEGRRLPGVPKGALPVGALSGRARPDVELPELDPHREALVVFTSGTTKDPKAVVHTGGSLQAASQMLAQVYSASPGEFVHTEQMLLGLPALQNGATWSLPASGPGEKLIQFASGLDGAVVTYLVPRDLHRLLNGVTRGQVPAKGPRIGLIGGGPAPAELLRRAHEAFPDTKWLSVYGMTEMLPVSVATVEEKLKHLQVGDCVGKPLPGIKARLASEPVGELILSGPNLMSGYLNKERAHEQHTGDLARIGPEGEIILVGRKKDMLIRGVTNIYPGLFEPRLTQLRGVVNAAMVGIRTEYGDDRIVLAIQPETWSQADTDISSEHAVLKEVEADLAHIIDHDALPDIVVAVRDFPHSGRASKLDRLALAQKIAAWEGSGL